MKSEFWEDVSISILIFRELHLGAGAVEFTEQWRTGFSELNRGGILMI